MILKALKYHYADGIRRYISDIFEIEDSNLAKGLIAQKCAEEVNEMGYGKKSTKGGKKK